jgi:putative ubiquitin-RnfH superfamily antitoxin RatB of RatAB toxin-antitoxin module
MSGSIRVEVLYAECGKAWRLPLDLAPGTTVGALLARLPGLVPHWPSAAFAPAATAVFGREVFADVALADGERLELLRALPTDPKRARRARAETTKPR